MACVRYGQLNTQIFGQLFMYALGFSESEETIVHKNGMESIPNCFTDDDDLQSVNVFLSIRLRLWRLVGNKGLENTYCISLAATYS